ncbi:MAG: NAD-dependent epimerase/dehydratase family protein, partial [Cellulosilyticaceae bacterium]
STLILCEIMSEYNIKKMVFSSSEGFYGDNGSQTSVYGSAKLMIERILSEVYKADPSWAIQIVRYLNKENDIYNTEHINVEDMTKIYIDAFKDIQEGTLETYELNFDNQTISLEPANVYSEYLVK